MMLTSKQRRSARRGQITGAFIQLTWPWNSRPSLHKIVYLETSGGNIRGWTRNFSFYVINGELYIQVGEDNPYYTYDGEWTIRNKRNVSRNSS